MTTITDEQVEAAAKALYEFAGDGELWEDAPAYWKDTSRKKARAALTAAAQAGKDAWQLIDTAPYQQTVFVGQDCGPLRVTAYRMSPRSGWRHAHSADTICFEPTHWRPIPEPPHKSERVEPPLPAAERSCPSCLRESPNGSGDICPYCDNPYTAPAPATPGRADDWQLVPKSLRDEIDNLIKVWQDAPSGVSFGRYMENALSKLCAERDKLALAAAASPSAPAQSVEGISQSQLREIIARFHRNACYPDAADFELYTVVSQILAHIGKPRSPWPPCMAPDGGECCAHYHEAIDRIATLTKELVEARKVIEPFAKEAETHSDKMPDFMIIDDYEGSGCKVKNINIGYLRAARDWLERNKANAWEGACVERCPHGLHPVNCLVCLNKGFTNAQTPLP